LFIFFSFYKKRCWLEKSMHHNNLLFLKKATFFFGKPAFPNQADPGSSGGRPVFLSALFRKPVSNFSQAHGL
jgi:hypothetical protein